MRPTGSFAWIWAIGPRIARHRPAPPQPEADALYRAVQALRAAGHRVYRSGALHRVDELVHGVSRAKINAI